MNSHGEERGTGTIQNQMKDNLGRFYQTIVGTCFTRRRQNGEGRTRF